jgi:CheY-like chemotaxis protein
VTVASTAHEALDEMRNSVPDVLLSDIGLPGMSGYELIRNVRAMPADKGGDVLAIAITAYAGEGDRAQALEAGFQRHIAKPVEPATLVSAITGLMATRQRA